MISRREIFELFVHEGPEIHQNMALLRLKPRPPPLRKKYIETESAFLHDQKTISETEIEAPPHPDQIIIEAESDFFILHFHEF